MSLTPDQQAMLARRLAGGAARRAGIPVAPAGPVPLSAEQEQLVHHGWLAPGDPLYNECVCLVHRGRLDADALRVAVDALVARYDAWHLAVRREGRRFVQEELPPPSHPLPVHDLRGAPDGALAALVAPLVRTPYDLRTGPTVRPLLVRTADEEHRLYLGMHHLVFDGVCLARVVVPELAALYAAAAAGRPADLGPPASYRDYAAWQAGEVEAELAAHLPWWGGHLADAPVLDLPLARPRPSEPRHDGDTAWFVIPAATADGLRTVARDAGCTLFQALAGAFARFLADLTGQDELVFATVVDRRRRSGLEQLVGYCVTPLPLRVRVPRDAGSAGLLGAVRDELFAAMAHAIPFGRLVRELDPPRPDGAAPVYQAMVVLEPHVPAGDAGWSWEQHDAGLGIDLGGAKSDVHLELEERPDGSLGGRLVVNRYLFGAGFAARCAGSFQRSADAVAGIPGPGPGDSSGPDLPITHG